MRIAPLTLLFTALFSLATLTATTHAADAPLGPALTQIGAKFGKSWQFKEPYLAFKTDAPLTEDAWKEIETLKPNYISANGKGIDDAAVARLARLPLQGIGLDGTSVTEAVFKTLGQIKTLKQLSMSHVLGIKGTDADALMNHPALAIVSIGGTGFGDAGMKALASLRQLTKLGLNHDQITDAGLAALANHPTLESLMFSPQMTPRITDASLPTVATLKALKELQINDTVLTYDGGLKLLKALPNLQKLTLNNIGLAETDLAKLKADLPKVDIKFTPASAELVAKWQQQLAKKLAQSPQPHR